MVNAQTARCRATCATTFTAVFGAVLGAIALSACSKSDLEAAAVTELPQRPLASKIECEELSEVETQACLQEGPDARRVCWKVAKNDAICDGNQEFIDRLYEKRQGK